MLAAVNEVVGRARVLRVTAAYAASYGPGWLGTPWWSTAAALFVRFASTGVPALVEVSGAALGHAAGLTQPGPPTQQLTW